ncbi:hypothetical protein Poli38472_012383 [Pythium oligandrum]|uniref:Uncharacterized protein n=1 Tax=Pythium oligandrum TaxID=41045 RepID=A0A8K1CPB1_PYTOL|nr:hypothetical protein Poli38472_012383 [Pythium oligandrum]|eukprot:TMW67267.1 hypothetical protein Poli38472_012383 [Pythium oligandrum]
MQASGKQLTHAKNTHRGLSRPGCVFWEEWLHLVVMNGSNAAVSAIRSLHADFERKGIVVSDGEGGSSAFELDLKLQRLITRLKDACKSDKQDLKDVASAIQLWKERSLHHTLQTLDRFGAKANDNGGSAREEQIQAIELHEKAGREINDAVFRVVQQLLETINRQIEAFSVQLTTTMRELIKPELEEELAKEQMMVHRLIDERQKLTQQHSTLQEENTQLTERIDVLENSLDGGGGGDAILCRKLRLQVRELKETQQTLESQMQVMQQEHERWRWEVTQVREDMERQQKTLWMTKAMHDKETKQLVDLVHMKEGRFQEVMTATAQATKDTSLLSPIALYDANSGQSIYYKSPQKPEPSKPKTRLVTLGPSSPNGRCRLDLGRNDGPVESTRTCESSWIR